MFNLLPIPPLDGSHVLKYLLPPAWASSTSRSGSTASSFSSRCCTSVSASRCLARTGVTGAGSSAAGRALHRAESVSAGHVIGERRRHRADAAGADVRRAGRHRRLAVRRRAGSVFGAARSAAHADSRRTGRHLRTSRSRASASNFWRASTSSAWTRRPSISRWPRGCSASRSQMLLPRHGDDETWDDPRAELVRRLLEYQQMREVVDVLEQRGEDAAATGSRAAYLPVEAVAPPPSPLVALARRTAGGGGSRAAHAARAGRARHRAARARCGRRDRNDPRGAGAAGERALARRRARSTPSRGKCCRRCSRLLELARRGELRLRQPRPFADVEISRDAASEAA